MPTPANSPAAPSLVRARASGRLSVAATMAMHGIANFDDEAFMDSVVPACCAEGCEVEADGRCEHGHPSLLLALGVI